MGRKRRASSPALAPPPPPPQESSAESGSDTEEDEVEEPPHAAAAPKPPQNPQPQPSAAAADDSDSSEEESDSDADADAHAFQVRPVSRSPAKPAAAATQPESDANEEEKEDGESSESEPEVREPVQMKSAAAEKSKAAEQRDKKRPAPEPAASGREKKAKKPGGKLEESGLDSPPPPSKSERSKHRRAWTNADLVRILEAIAAHVKTEGVLPKTDVLHAAVRDRLERKDSSRDELYRKIQYLKKQYEKTVATGTAPIGKDTVRMYNLSEEIWGEKAKEAIAAASKNGSSVSKSKKGQAQKEEMDGNSKVGTPKEVANQNGDTQKGSKKANKSKQQGNTKAELGKDAKSGTSKESAATAMQNGDALTNLERGTVNKDKMDIDPIPKEPSTGNANAGTLTEEETHQGETEVGACVQHTHRSFDELQNLYPCLAGCVQMIEAQHPYGESLKRAFESIDDEKADALESKIEALGLLEVQEEINRDNLKKEVVNMLIDLKD